MINLGGIGFVAIWFFASALSLLPTIPGAIELFWNKDLKEVKVYSLVGIYLSVAAIIGLVGLRIKSEYIFSIFIYLGPSVIGLFLSLGLLCSTWRGRTSG